MRPDEDEVDAAAEGAYDDDTRDDEDSVDLEGLTEPEQVAELARHVAEQKALLKQKMDFVQSQLAIPTVTLGSAEAVSH